MAKGPPYAPPATPLFVIHEGATPESPAPRPCPSCPHSEYILSLISSETLNITADVHICGTLCKPEFTGETTPDPLKGTRSCQEDSTKARTHTSAGCKALSSSPVLQNMLMRALIKDVDPFLMICWPPLAPNQTFVSTFECVTSPTLFSCVCFLKETRRSAVFHVLPAPANCRINPVSTYVTGRDEGDEGLTSPVCAGGMQRTTEREERKFSLEASNAHSLMQRKQKKNSTEEL